MSKENTNKENPYDHQDVRNPDNSNNQPLEAKWEVIKKDYQQQYPALNDDDLQYLPGEFEEMMSLIASKTQRSRAEVNNEIRRWET